MRATLYLALPFLATSALARTVYPSPPIYAPPPITEERQEAIMMVRNLEYRLAALRGTLFDERQWTHTMRATYYAERIDALTLEECLDDPQTMPDDIQRAFADMKGSYNLLMNAVPSVSTPVSNLRVQIENRLKELDTLIYTIPD